MTGDVWTDVSDGTAHRAFLAHCYAFQTRLANNPAAGEYEVLNLALQLDEDGLQVECRSFPAGACERTHIRVHAKPRAPIRVHSKPPQAAPAPAR